MNELLQDLAITAFEGGSNYWYQIESDTHGNYLETLFKDGLQVSDAMANEKPVTYHLNKDKMENALAIMNRDYPRHYQDAIKENFDAETGDVFLQCALFGKVIYG